MIPVLVLALLPGCFRRDLPPETATELPPTYSSFTSLGPAPWDGFVVTIRNVDEELPYVIGPDGEVALDTRPHPPYYDGVWTGPKGELPPGDYTLVGQDGEDLGWGASFTVEDYGRLDDFDQQSVAGAVWRIDGESLFAFGSVLTADVLGGELYLVIDEVEGGQAHFRIVQDNEELGQCGLLADTARLGTTGEFFWEGTNVVWSTEPSLLAERMSVRFGVGADGDGAGFEVVIAGDTRDLSAHLYEDDDPEALCNGIGSFGGYCEACGDGTESCTHLAFQGGLLEVSDFEVEAEVDGCPANLPQDEIPTCSTVGPLVVSLFPIGLALALIRRRESATAEPE